MSRKLVHNFGHLAENLSFRHLAVGLHHLALIEKLRLWSPRAERKNFDFGHLAHRSVMREVTKVKVFFSLREVTKVKVFL